MLRKTADVNFSRNGGEIVAHIGGEIDHHGAKEIRHAIDTKLSDDPPDKLILDLSQVKFMDSSGLGLILGRYNCATKLGIGFSVRNPSPSAERIISAAGAERIIKILREKKS